MRVFIMFLFLGQHLFYVCTVCASDCAFGFEKVFDSLSYVLLLV